MRIIHEKYRCGRCKGRLGYDDTDPDWLTCIDCSRQIRIRAEAPRKPLPPLEEPKTPKAGRPLL